MEYKDLFEQSATWLFKQREIDKSRFISNNHSFLDLVQEQIVINRSICL